ncbi:DUF1707 domain-containing protein [Kribbella sp. NPDC054772]
MTDNPVLEQVLLQHLQFAPLTRAELVRRAGSTDQEVQATLDELVSGTFVVRRPQDGLPAEYELTPAGVVRLKTVQELFSSPFAALGKTIGGAIIEAKRRPAGERPRPRARQTVQDMVRDKVLDKLLLSDADRLLCSTALGEQFGLGRIDKPELDRRTNLLYAAKTRGDLTAVFDGLPDPVLDKPSAVLPGVPKWRKVVFQLAFWLSVPFLFSGFALVATHHDLGDLIGGLIMLAGAGTWDYFAWTWATKGRRSD